MDWGAESEHGELPLGIECGAYSSFRPKSPPLVQASRLARQLCYHPPVILRRRQFGVLCGALSTGILIPQGAYASTVLALSLEDLVGRSERVVVGVPVLSESEWASVAGSRRIVTYTRVVQEQDWLSDEEKTDEVIVVTMGGRVGDIQQKVSGEAALRPEERCVLFAGPEGSGFRRVMGMGQGHYPIRDDEKIAHLQRSPSMPHLVGEKRGADAPPRRRRAVDVLDGASLTAARDLVLGAR